MEFTLIACAAWGFIGIEIYYHGFARFAELLGSPEGGFEEFASVVLWLTILTACVCTGYATGVIVA